MPQGKPAGVRCVQLGADERCLIFGQPERPSVCGSLRPSDEMCGDGRVYAIEWLGRMEASTAPARALTEGPQVPVGGEAQSLTRTAIR